MQYPYLRNFDSRFHCPTDRQACKENWFRMVIKKNAPRAFVEAETGPSLGLGGIFLLSVRLPKQPWRKGCLLSSEQQLCVGFATKRISKSWWYTRYGIDRGMQTPPLSMLLHPQPPCCTRLLHSRLWNSGCLISYSGRRVRRCSDLLHHQIHGWPEEGSDWPWLNWWPISGTHSMRDVCAMSVIWQRRLGSLNGLFQ